jgi:hypothetical protein
LQSSDARPLRNSEARRGHASSARLQEVHHHLLAVGRDQAQAGVASVDRSSSAHAVSGHDAGGQTSDNSERIHRMRQEQGEAHDQLYRSQGESGCERFSSNDLIQRE